MDTRLEKIKEAVVGGKHNEIEDLVKSALNDKIELDSIINDALISAMDVVGQKYSNNEIYVPEMLVSAITMKKGLDIINPLLQEGEKESKGKIIMCTVKGDIHDIGKNLVIMMLQGAGFDVINLGVDMTTDKVVEQVIKVKPDIVGLSALLTTTMPAMKTLIEALVEKGLRNNVKVMVGGAPVNAEWAKKIGADGYAPDAGKAVELARSLVA
jgi:5-methyltetrahydrofolate--homocysteine methyltransferase